MTELGGLTRLAGPGHRPAGWGVDSPVTLGTPCRRGTGRATTTPRLVPTISRPWQTSRLVTHSRWCPGRRERDSLARCHAGWTQTCQTAQRVLPSPVTPHLPIFGIFCVGHRPHLPGEQAWSPAVSGLLCPCQGPSPPCPRGQDRHGDKGRRQLQALNGVGTLRGTIPASAAAWCCPQTTGRPAPVSSAAPGLRHIKERPPALHK